MLGYMSLQKVIYFDSYYCMYCTAVFKPLRKANNDIHGKNSFICIWTVLEQNSIS